MSKFTIFAPMYSFTEENYIKAIYKLHEQSLESVTTNSIAEILQTKAASVTDMLQKLSNKKLLKYEKYKGVLLTDKGRKIAIEIIRKHRLWETFLFDKLQFGWDEVHEIAEQLEHIQSENLVNKLDDFLGNPTHDPHGDPIPDRQGEIRKSNLMLLSNLSVGVKSVMSGVVDHGSLFLQHLDKLNIKLGKTFEIIEISAYDGSLKVKADGKNMEMSKDVAKNILVKMVN